MNRSCFALLVFVFGVFGGCANSQRSAAVTPQNPREVPLFSGEGDLVSWEQLVSAARKADVVIVGENHGHPVGLPFAAELWQDVLAASPDAALSMEFFERDEQSRLDEYLRGVVDEATFRRRTGRTPSNYPAAHREMVEAAKAAGRPVIAANAPRPLVRLARTDGYERLQALSREQQRMFVIPSFLPEGRYRDDFFRLMSPAKVPGAAADSSKSSGAAHGAQETDTRAESMFRSQSLWDWTMADSIARGLAEGNRPVFHIVGRFHSDHDGGLVQALRHMKPDARVLTISMVNRQSTSLQEQDIGRGDFVVYVGPGAD